MLPNSLCTREYVLCLLIVKTDTNAEDSGNSSRGRTRRLSDQTSRSDSKTITMSKVCSILFGIAWLFEFRICIVVGFFWFSWGSRDRRELGNWLLFFVFFFQKQKKEKKGMLCFTWIVVGREIWEKEKKFIRLLQMVIISGLVAVVGGNGSRKKFVNKL